MFHFSNFQIANLFCKQLCKLWTYTLTESTVPNFLQKKIPCKPHARLPASPHHRLQASQVSSTRNSATLMKRPVPTM